ncbi:MAG: hypothetical protein HY901_11205 [Deltaproteobacteria bacterium]|nr:hypothetical protein [Deltaproteobacteria bacterium]
MPYGLLALLLLAVALFLALRSRTRAQAAAPPPPSPPPGVSSGAMSGGPLSRDELAAKLRRLSESKPPAQLNPGAMCYSTARPPETAEYLCPRCGARTHYSKNTVVVRLIQRELPSMREAVKALPGIEASLEESELCSKCQPDRPAVPLPTLAVHHPDGSVTRTRGVGMDDLKLLKEFLEGKPAHAGGRDAETSLKKHLSRIGELLGVQVPEGAQE